MGKSELCRLVLVLTLVARACCQSCVRVNWRSSFASAGISPCGGPDQYMSGFFRGPVGSPDDITRLQEAFCCQAPNEWTGKEVVTMHADWESLFDNNNQWVYCPTGYFLSGLKRSNEGGSQGLLHSINAGRCVKPADHPNSYFHCYDHDISACMKGEGSCKCEHGHFVVGLHRGSCNELKCLDQMRCCRFATTPEPLNEVYKVKTRVMDSTLEDMAKLANMLGYGWCSGCKSTYVGEDFLRDGDKWAPDMTGGCSGYNADERLHIAFGNWNFVTSNMVYGEPIVEELTPEAVDSGILFNNDPTEAVKSVTLTEESVRSVSHVTTSAWKHSHELGVQLYYKPPKAKGGFGVSLTYKFGYEGSSSTTDETQTKQVKRFELQTEKVLPAYKAAKWTLFLNKTRTTVPYTATITARFSTEFKGFLRHGGGYYGADPNFHYKYRGGDNRPTFNYMFGDSETPFYVALKEQSEVGALPWLWYDMEQHYPDNKRLIKELADEKRYSFTLTGKFEDIAGKTVELHWDKVDPSEGRFRRDEGHGQDAHSHVVRRATHVATAGPHDPPAPNPVPPEVDLKVISTPQKYQHVLATGD